MLWPWTEARVVGVKVHSSGTPVWLHNAFIHRTSNQETCSHERQKAVLLLSTSTVTGSSWTGVATKKRKRCVNE